MSLHDYGWCTFFSESLESLNDPSLAPGRVVFTSGGTCRLVTRAGEVTLPLAGKLRLREGPTQGPPVVGDWVAFGGDPGGGGRVELVLPRRSRLSRKVPGKKSEEQVVAANIDIVLVVMGLDGDFSIRRLERYLTLVREGGARPAVLLNKIDLCAELQGKKREIEAAAPGVPVLPVSATEGTGLDAVGVSVAPGATAVLVGSSGAGKSTIINRLLGREAQRTRPVREGDDSGRHTTTHRELFRLPSGGLLIDSPGLREVQLWAGSGSLSRSFEDIEALAAGCRYGNCSHGSEPGCAVLAAVAEGRLAPGRLESLRSLRREIEYLDSRVDGAVRRERNRRWRALHKDMKRWYKPRRI